MTFNDLNQQPYQNPQMQHSQSFAQQGLPGQAAYGPYANTGQSNWGGGWNQQRQLTQQDVSEVVRQLAPILPHILSQAQQQQPQAAFGYNNQRTLSPQDVNEVVRQILPVIPQIVGALSNQGGMGGQYGGAQGLGGQGFGQSFGQNLPFQAAYGSQNGQWQQRQLGQQDIQEVVRQLVSAIPQVIGNLQGAQRQN